MRVYCRFAPTRPEQHQRGPASVKCLHIAVDSFKNNEVALSRNPSTNKLDHSSSYKALTVADLSTGASVSIGCDEVFFPVPECSQCDVFDSITAPLLDAVLHHGMNRSLLAYGQTSTGKTHTMFGPDGGNTLYFDSVDSRGIVPRLGEAMFGSHEREEIGNGVQGEKVTAVDVRYFEIYNEQLTDLVAKALVEVYDGVDISAAVTGGNKRKGVCQSKHQYQITYRSTEKAKVRRSLQKITCRSASELNQLLCKLTDMREVKSTESNLRSSRSHVVLQLTVSGVSSPHAGRANSITPATKDRCVPQGARSASYTSYSSSRVVVGGQLTIADLAGSECLRGLTGNSKSGPYSAGASSVDIFEKPYVTMKIQQESRMRIQETKNINTSLFALKKVVHALHVGDVHIPFKDSMLTVALEDALQPQSALIICCSSEGSDIAETFATLRFASEASKINPPTAMVNIHNQAVFEEQHYQKRLEDEILSRQRESDSERAIAMSVSCLRRSTSTATDRSKGTTHQRIDFACQGKDGSPCLSCQDEYVTYESGTPLPNINDCYYKDCVQKRRDNQDIMYVNNNGKPLRVVREEERRCCHEEDDSISHDMKKKKNTKNTVTVLSPEFQNALDDANQIIFALQERCKTLSNSYEEVLQSLDDCQKEKMLMQEEHEANMNALKVELSCLKNELFLAEACTKSTASKATDTNIDYMDTHSESSTWHRKSSMIPSLNSMIIKEELVRQQKTQLSLVEETAAKDVSSEEEAAAKEPPSRGGECDIYSKTLDASSPYEDSGDMEFVEVSYENIYQGSEKDPQGDHESDTHHTTLTLSQRYPLTNNILSSTNLQRAMNNQEVDQKVNANENSRCVIVDRNIPDSSGTGAESFIDPERRLWGTECEESTELDVSIHDQHFRNSSCESRRNKVNDTTALIKGMFSSYSTVMSEDPPSPVSVKMNESCFGIVEKETEHCCKREGIKNGQEEKDGTDNSKSQLSRSPSTDQLGSCSTSQPQIQTTSSLSTEATTTFAKKASANNPLRNEIAKILERPLRTSSASRAGLLSDVLTRRPSSSPTSYSDDYGGRSTKDRQTTRSKSTCSSILTSSLLIASATGTELSSRITNENKENDTTNMPRFSAADTGVHSKTVNDQPEAQQTKHGTTVLCNVPYSYANANQPHHPPGSCTSDNTITPVQSIKEKQRQNQRQKIVKVFSPQSVPH